MEKSLSNSRRCFAFRPDLETSCLRRASLRLGRRGFGILSFARVCVSCRILHYASSRFRFDCPLEPIQIVARTRRRVFPNSAVTLNPSLHDLLELRVLLISWRLVPRGATGLKWALRNIPGVPNQSHSGTAPIFFDTTG